MMMTLRCDNSVIIIMIVLIIVMYVWNKATGMDSQELLLNRKECQMTKKVDPKRAQTIFSKEKNFQICFFYFIFYYLGRRFSYDSVVGMVFSLYNIVDDIQSSQLNICQLVFFSACVSKVYIRGTQTNVNYFFVCC